MNGCSGIHKHPAAAHHARPALSAPPDRPPPKQAARFAPRSHSACSFTCCWTPGTAARAERADSAAAAGPQDGRAPQNPSGWLGLLVCWACGRGWPDLAVEPKRVWVNTATRYDKLASAVQHCQHKSADENSHATAAICIHMGMARCLLAFKSVLATLGRTLFQLCCLLSPCLWSVTRVLQVHSPAPVRTTTQAHVLSSSLAPLSQCGHASPACCWLLGLACCGVAVPTAPCTAGACARTALALLHAGCTAGRRMAARR
jgi:hypothetical protein